MDEGVVSDMHTLGRQFTLTNKMDSWVQLTEVMHVCLPDELVGMQDLRRLVHLGRVVILWRRHRGRNDTACVLRQDDAVVDEVAERKLFVEHSIVRSGE